MWAAIPIFLVRESLDLDAIEIHRGTKAR